MSEQPDKRDQQVFKRIVALNSDIKQYLDLAPTLKLQPDQKGGRKRLPVQLYWIRQPRSL